MSSKAWRSISLAASGTIPAWISSIRRANQSVNFSAISSGARQAARKELILLKHEVEAVLHTIKKEG